MRAGHWLILLVVIATRVSGGPRYSSRIVETRTGPIRGIILELNSGRLEPVEAFLGVKYATATRYGSAGPVPRWSSTKLADSQPPVCPQAMPDISNKTAALLNMPKNRYFFLKKLSPLLANQTEDCLHLNMYVPGSGVRGGICQISHRHAQANNKYMNKDYDATKESSFIIYQDCNNLYGLAMTQPLPYGGFEWFENPHCLTEQEIISMDDFGDEGSRGIEAPYAVMVYLHGESFDWNSGNHYDGRVLASYGHVIFITVNYRLGLLGFLRAGSGIDSPLAMGDVIAALRWVKENIASFGGDPRRVTLMGHDTGAALANLLLISPQAKGYFTRVALVSGSILSPWAVAQDPIGLREKVGAELGCKTGPKDDLAKCLRGLPLSAILSVRVTSPRFLTGVGPWTKTDPSTAVETSGEPFVSSRLLLGTTTTESFLDFNNQDIQYGIEEDQRNRVLRTYVRNAYVYHLNEIFSTVRNEYTDWEKPIQHPINIRDSTLEALSDGHTVAPLLRLGYLHSRRGSPTYFYHFNYQTKESDYPQRLGSVRGEDVNYLLGLPLVGGYPYFPQNYTTQDHKVAESVLNFFTNFAKTGDPNEPRRMEGTPSHSKEKGRHRGFNWDLYEPTTQLYLSLSTKPRMKSHYRGHKMAIWLNLIPQLHQPGDQDVSMRHHHFHERANHFYSGAIKAESFTRVPPTVGSSTNRPSEFVECPPNVTGSSDEPMGLSDLGASGKKVEEPDDSDEDDEADLLERHYYSTSTALGVTVGVGCLLLVLNALIFSAIYYQRKRRKSREAEEVEQVEIKTLSDTSTNALPVKHPPTPPLRTSSVPPPGTVKKRVQIQEISV